MTDSYVRRADVIRVIDGDSFEFQISLGYRVYSRVLIRLRGINCAELSTVDGQRAKVAAERLFRDAKVITVKSYKDQMSFARWLADVYIDNVPMVDLLHQVLG